MFRSVSEPGWCRGGVEGALVSGFWMLCDVTSKLHVTGGETDSCIACCVSVGQRNTDVRTCVLPHSCCILLSCSLCSPVSLVVHLLYQ